MSNILYRAFYANIREDEDILVSMCHHSGLMTMQYLNNKYNPDEIVAVFDSTSWRKAYTKYASISHKKYKGNRRQNLTVRQQEQLAVFDNHIIEFYEFIRDHSSLIVLKAPMLECDDLVAEFIDSHPNDKHILISTDKDFMQLLDNKNVTIIEPDKEKQRTLDEWNGDARHFMFEKCIRGDTSDNVQSSYPKLRKTKIDEAYTDSYLRTNLMNHEFDVEVLQDDGTMKTHHYKTEDLYNENILLMDLRQQPPEIKKAMKKAVTKALKERGNFNLIEFYKFCGKHELERIQDNPKTITKMLNTRAKPEFGDLGDIFG
jgi:hypothetical protein